MSFIKPMSDRRRQVMVEYTKKKRLFFKANPKCAKPFCKRGATDIHHTRGRAGSLLLDERFWKGLCRSCHDWVGEHPIESRQIGLLCQPGEWNTPKRD